MVSCAIRVAAAALVASHAVAQAPPTPLTTATATYTVPASSAVVFSVAADAAPTAPACPSACPEQGYLVCAGACPVDCFCFGGFGVYVNMESVGGSATGLAFAMGDQAPDASVRDAATAYTKFTATAEWSVLPFITLFSHTEEVANSRKRSSKHEVYGLVDLCKITAHAGSMATPVGDAAQLDCNCDDCGDSCGVVGSRKVQACAVDGDGDGSADPLTPQYDDGCTYYASSDALGSLAHDMDFCCNAIPAAFEDYIGAVEQHPHFHDWRGPPKTRFSKWVESNCNLTTGVSSGAQLFEQLAISRCDDSFKTGTYYLWAVNTGDAPKTVKLGYSIATVSDTEAATCWGNRFDGTLIGTGGAWRPLASRSLATLAAALACMCMYW